MKFKMKKDLKQQVEKEDAGGKDPRILPYYNLKKDEKMKVLIIPDVNGEPWANYSLHGPNLKTRGIQAIRCPYKAGHGDCPVCSKGFDLLDENKDEAKRWFAKDYTLASVIVVETPIEVPESDDENVVKLWHMPYAVHSMIKEQIKEGQITPETLATTPLVIKKTENKGGQASYEHSYFDYRGTIEEDELDELLEGEVVEQFDYDNLDDVIKPIVDVEELEEWLEKAEEKDSKAKKSSGGSGKKRGKSSLKERMKSKSDDGDDEQEESGETEEEVDNTSPDEAMDESQEEEKEETEPKRRSSGGASALRERLRQRKG